MVCGENGSVRTLTLLVVVAAAFLTGCSGSVREDGSLVPGPSLVRFLPHGYRVAKTYRADLTGGAVRDVVVTSENPREAGADIQVLSWSNETRRWRLAFDGMKASQPNVVEGPDTPNNGPGDSWGPFHTGNAPVIGNLNYAIGPVVSREIEVAFAPLLGGDRDQLVFGGGYVACCSVPGFLAVASFHAGIGKLIYVWQGVPGLDWHIGRNVIRAQSSYLIAGAAEVGPYSAYRFTLAARAGRIVEVYDTRPLLGVVLRHTRIGPRIVLTVPRGPAAGRLRPGDVILSIENGLKTAYPNANGVKVVGAGSKSTLRYDIFDTLSSFRAGQTARLLIQRGNKRLTVRVKLGSLMSPAASAIRTPTSNGSEGAL
jgi:hypothetical protein